MRIKTLLLSFSLVWATLTWAQQPNIMTPEQTLNQVAIDYPNINAKMQMDITGMTLYELITAIAEEHKLNISADIGLNQIVASNFYEVTVKDVFLFLIDKYKLEIRYTNHILIFKKQAPKIEKPKPKPKKNIDIKYTKANDLLSIKLKNDSLVLVAQKITELSGRNMVLSPKVKNNLVSTYIVNRPFDQVVEMLAKSNQLTVNKDENDFYFLDKDQNQVNTNTNTRSRRSSSNRNNQRRTTEEMPEEGVKIQKNENGYLQVNVVDAKATAVIVQAAKTLGLNYFMYDKPDDINVNLSVANLSFEDLLEHLLKNSNFTYKLEEDYYLIGKSTAKGLQQTQLIQLQNRPLENVLNTIPSSIKKDLEIKEFIELNGVLVSGAPDKIALLESVIYQLDQFVPLVQIEVMIVEYRKSYDVTTGLQGIIGDGATPVTTAGRLAPETNLVANSTSINKLIDAFNGIGLINIGKVTSDFYANLNALESNSIVKVESTPKIATLSGHNAKVSVGETRYYFEQTNSLINTGVNNNVLQSGQYKSTQANMSLNITPHVSKDNHVTMAINVEQSSFLLDGISGAPPGKATRQFESLIRVNNQEMVLLGGLNEFSKENSGQGVPFLARIPIIKWFFSSKTRAKSKTKLHVFIKPTIVY